MFTQKAAKILKTRVKRCLHLTQKKILFQLPNYLYFQVRTYSQHRYFIFYLFTFSIGIKKKTCLHVFERVLSFNVNTVFISQRKIALTASDPRAPNLTPRVLLGRKRPQQTLPHRSLGVAAQHPKGPVRTPTSPQPPQEVPPQVTHSHRQGMVWLIDRTPTSAFQVGKLCVLWASLATSGITQGPLVALTESHAAQQQRAWSTLAVEKAQISLYSVTSMCQKAESCIPHT